MTVDDASGAVTLYNRGRPAIVADDLGVTVLAPRGRDRRLAWSEISYFADGSLTGQQWALDIVLRAGPTVSVACASAPGALEAIQQVAERYGIPADLTGVRMINGLPPEPGLYEDPGDSAGLRYWDGALWSPVLPRAAAKWGEVGGLTVRDSAPGWVDLPAAPEPWDYPAARAARAKAWVWRSGLATAAGAAAGLALGIYTRSWSDAGYFLLFVDGWPALWLYAALCTWYPWRKLERWVGSSGGSVSKRE